MWISLWTYETSDKFSRIILFKSCMKISWIYQAATLGTYPLAMELLAEAFWHQGKIMRVSISSQIQREYTNYSGGCLKMQKKCNGIEVQYLRYIIKKQKEVSRCKRLERCYIMWPMRVATLLHPNLNQTYQSSLPPPTFVQSSFIQMRIGLRLVALFSCVFGPTWNVI